MESDKTSRFSVSDQQKASSEEAAANILGEFFVTNISARPRWYLSQDFAGAVRNWYDKSVVLVPGKHFYMIW